MPVPSSRLLTWQRSPLLAHVVPLLAFMLLSEIASLVKIENSALPWYRSAPEHWVYPMQCVIIAGVLWFFRSHYTLRPWRGWPLAVALGIVGIAVWILPSWLHETLPRDDAKLPAWYEWLGITARREGFDPTLFSNDSAAYWTTTLLRLARMTFIVPLVEEIFWRGFLMRYVQAGERPFLRVPFGQHSWAAFVIVTGAFMLIHQPSDYLGAWVFGSLMYLLAVRTQSLGACVVMHATANLALGLYVLRTEQWGLW